jgi:hypothetical protein
MPILLAAAVETLALVSSIVAVAVIVAGLLEERAGMRAWRNVLAQFDVEKRAPIHIAAAPVVARDAHARVA